MRDDINLGKEMRKEPGQRMGAGGVVERNVGGGVSIFVLLMITVKGFWNYLSQIIGGSLR